MKKIIYFTIVTASSLNAVNPVDSWTDHYLRPNTVYIEDENRIPDIHSYKWLEYIYQQCADITLVKQVSENNKLYQAIIKKNNKITTKRLNQYVRRWAKAFGGAVLSYIGYLLLADTIQNFPITEFQENHLTVKGAESLNMIGAGLILVIPGISLIIKTIIERSKLKKTLKLNQKMLAALQTIDNQ